MADSDLRTVPVDLLDAADDNRELDPDDPLIASLAESIRESGVIDPLIIEPAAHGRWKIVDGHRRWLAANLAGVESVPATVRSFKDEHERHLTMLLANQHREDWNPLDEARIFALLLAPASDGTPPLSQRKLAARLGCSQAHISRRIALLDLPEPAKNRLRAGTLGVKDAEALTRLLPHIGRILDCLDPDVAWPSITAAVAYHEQQIAQERRRDELRAQLEAQGRRTAVQYDGRWPAGWAYVDRLSEEVQAIHEQADCHVTGILDNGNLVGLCSEPARHRQRRRVPAPSTAPSRPDGTSEGNGTLMTASAPHSSRDAARAAREEARRLRELTTLAGLGWQVEIRHGDDKPLVVTVDGAYTVSEARELADAIRQQAARVQAG